jgi:hypothetical protein
MVASVQERRSYLQHFPFASIADVGADSDWDAVGQKRSFAAPERWKFSLSCCKIIGSYCEQFITWRLL